MCITHTNMYDTMRSTVLSVEQTDEPNKLAIHSLSSVNSARMPDLFTCV